MDTNVKSDASQPDTRTQAADAASGDPHDDDLAQLQALGFKSDFKRDMSPWANFSLGFTYLSPVVGIYTLFAFALAAADRR